MGSTQPTTRPGTSLGSASTASKTSRTMLPKENKSTASSNLDYGIEKVPTPQVNKTTGLKRPTTAFTQRPTAAQTASVGSSSSKASATPSIQGVVKAKALASGIRKPSEMKSSLVDKPKEEIEEH